MTQENIINNTLNRCIEDINRVYEDICTSTFIPFKEELLRLYIKYFLQRNLRDCDTTIELDDIDLKEQVQMVNEMFSCIFDYKEFKKKNFE